MLGGCLRGEGTAGLACLPCIGGGGGGGFGPSDVPSTAGPTGRAPAKTTLPGVGGAALGRRRCGRGSTARRRLPHRRRDWGSCQASSLACRPAGSGGRGGRLNRSLRGPLGRCATRRHGRGGSVQDRIIRDKAGARVTGGGPPGSRPARCRPRSGGYGGYGGRAGKGVGRAWAVGVSYPGSRPTRCRATPTRPICRDPGGRPGQVRATPPGWGACGHSQHQVRRAGAGDGQFCVVVSRFYENPIQNLFSEPEKLHQNPASRVSDQMGPGGSMRKWKKRTAEKVLAFSTSLEKQPRPRLASLGTLSGGLGRVKDGRWPWPPLGSCPHDLVVVGGALGGASSTAAPIAHTVGSWLVRARQAGTAPRTIVPGGDRPCG